MIVMANVAVGRQWASDMAGILCGLTAGALFLFGLAIVVGWLAPAGGGFQAQPLGITLIAVSAVIAVATYPPVLRHLARVLPLDPNNPVHALALALALLVIGIQFAFSTFVNVLSADQSSSPLTVVDLLSEQLPLLVVATVGVGLFMRREPRVTATRLGWVRPAWWHVALALAAAGVFIVFSGLLDALSQHATPDMWRSIQDTTNHLFGSLLTNPIGVIAVAVLPGICEETLFRGAVQPRLGIVLTALLFASIHSQYSISFDTLAVFVIGIGLGFIRKYTNTTTSCVAHASYNLITTLSLAGPLLAAAAVLEIALIAAASFGLWTNRRALVEPAPVP